MANSRDVPQDLIHASVQFNTTRKDFIASESLRSHAKVVAICGLVMKPGSDNFRAYGCQRIMKRINVKNVEGIIYEPALTDAEFYNSRVVNDLKAFKRDGYVINANRNTDELADPAEKVYIRDLFGSDL